MNKGFMEYNLKVIMGICVECKKKLDEGHIAVRCFDCLEYQRRWYWKKTEKDNLLADMSCEELGYF